MARQRLESLGIKVYDVQDLTRLPFGNGEFDLVIDRHAAYDPREVWRILKPGGLFITQQVGGQANRTLHGLLYDRAEGTSWNPASARDAGWDLEKATSDLEAVGFHIVEQREEFPITRFFDVGAIVYYLKAIAWEIPDFSVEKYFDRLLAIHRGIQTDGHLDVLFHQFFVRAQK
jgi:SAM-dependent methyltransferase